MLTFDYAAPVVVTGSSTPLIGREKPLAVSTGSGGTREKKTRVLSTVAHVWNGKRAMKFPRVEAP